MKSRIARNIAQHRICQLQKMKCVDVKLKIIQDLCGKNYRILMKERKITEIEILFSRIGRYNLLNMSTVTKCR
jgi:hypothetical protein